MTRIIVVLAAAIVLGACQDRASKLPVYDKVPEFTMTDSNGQAFHSQTLAGMVWVVDFIYTNCPGPCPRMTSQMHKVQQQVSGEKDIRLISISVDPDHDSPSVLNAFAHRFGGPADNWYFLTGSPATVHLLAHDVFKVGDLIAEMDHSTKFMLVDKQQNIRGYYSTFDADGMATLLEDLKALVRSK